MKYLAILLGGVLILIVGVIGLVQANELEEINQQKTQKEESLNKIYQEIEATQTANISLSQKISQLGNEVKKLKQISKGLDDDYQKIDRIYTKKTIEFAKSQKRLDDQRIDLYISTQRSVSQIILGSESLTDMLNTFMWHKIRYQSLLQSERDLKAEVVKNQELVTKLNNNRADIQKEIKKAQQKVNELVARQRILLAQLNQKYSQRNTLVSEITSLTTQATTIINKKANAIGNDNTGNANDGSGGGGGNVVPIQTSPGEFILYVDGNKINQVVEGPVRLLLKQGYFTVGAYKYRHSLEFRKDSNVVLINELPLQEYLQGLGEVPSSWPVETLKAQATAGRTYALANLGKRQAYYYDLRDDVNDQNYVGVNKEVASYGTKWVQAVAGSKDKVITANGSLITAYYHSTCGGHTLSSQEVWGGVRSYAQPRSDRYFSNGVWRSYDETSARSRWSAGNMKDTEVYMMDLLNASLYLQNAGLTGKAQDQIACVINKINQNTGVCGSNKSTVLTSNQLKQKLGTKEISKQIGTLNKITVTYDNNKSIIDQNVRSTKTVHAVGSKGTVSIPAGVFKLTYNLRAPGTNWIASTLFEVDKRSQNDWQVMSRGWGHRVGMCQYGAYGRAKQGQTYDQILKYYYSGTVIQNRSMNRNIRIGITKTGGGSTYISATENFIVSGKNGEITTVNKGSKLQIVR